MEKNVKKRVKFYLKWHSYGIYKNSRKVMVYMDVPGI